MSTLPSHRQFLTSLIEGLSSDPPQPSDVESHVIPPDRRQLLLTLHVLFPSILLPALDLLDRRLVSRVKISGAESPSEESQIYVVRSLGTTLGRRHRDAATPARSHVVRLTAWNCSCESFAFDSFPSGGQTAGGDRSPDQHIEEYFGGMSLDGLAASQDVPCCKHILACLLAEHWNGQLGQYLESKEVSREELAGIVGSS